jgi:hypothetical protein
LDRAKRQDLDPLYKRGAAPCAAGCVVRMPTTLCNAAAGCVVRMPTTLCNAAAGCVVRMPTTLCNAAAGCVVRNRDIPRALRN